MCTRLFNPPTTYLVHLHNDLENHLHIISNKDDAADVMTTNRMMWRMMTKRGGVCAFCAPAGLFTSHRAVSAQGRHMLPSYLLWETPCQQLTAIDRKIHLREHVYVLLLSYVNNCIEIMIKVNLGIVLLYPPDQGVSFLFSGLEAANLGVARPRGRR